MAASDVGRGGGARGHRPSGGQTRLVRADGGRGGGPLRGVRGQCVAHGVPPRRRRGRARPARRRGHPEVSAASGGRPAQPRVTAADQRRDGQSTCKSVSRRIWLSRRRADTSFRSTPSPIPTALGPGGGRRCSPAGRSCSTPSGFCVDELRSWAKATGGGSSAACGAWAKRRSKNSQLAGSGHQKSTVTKRQISWKSP